MINIKRLLGVLYFFLLSILLTDLIYAQLGKGQSSTIVSTTKPYISQTKPIIELTGSVYFSTQSNVAAESSGKVKRVLIEEGDFVKAGQPLIELDTELLSYSLSSAKSRVSQAKIAYERTTRDYERNKNLFDGGAISLTVFDDFKTAMQNARDAYNIAVADFNRLESEYKKMTIRSPISGNVTSRSVNIGEWVNTGASVANIASENYDARFFLPERLLPFVKVGEIVNLVISGKEYQGVILYINKKGESVTRTFLTKVKIGKNSSLREGLMITGIFPAGDNINAIFVTRDAIVTRNQSKGVYIIQDDVAKFIPVKVIGYRGKDIGISGDVKETDLIITKGNDKVGNGSKITIDKNQK